MSTRIVVFDMDGTLVQARGAAWEIFQETARKFDLPVRSAQEFFDLFNDNFFESLDRVAGDPARAETARQHFVTALQERYTPTLVPGMADVVKKLAPHYALAVMSSNAMTAIRRTLEEAGIARCFAHVFSADIASSKTNKLREVLADPLYGNVRRCSPEYVEDEPGSGDEVVLVTDTVGDVREGVAAGVRVVGVSWGMHSEEALVMAGAEFVACWPQELVTRLLPDGSCRAGACTCESGSCQTTGTCSVSPTVVGLDRLDLTRTTLDAVQRASANRLAVRRPGAPSPASASAAAVTKSSHDDSELTAALARISTHA
ncbi:MAG: phosphatase-like protein [Nocardioides sp.]|jgi:phosphoglycolate phosphatase|uniref:HAD family hydrolase n=1 Tax=Nocardioides sp. TaxID=35761 RepID=UPI002615B91B|nr:HAD hydrolase-like protein [Nocardioides sp.]MCW2833015.1 phosphatase-like protein [Nocardioides sp.]